MEIINAKREHANTLAHLVNLAGEGIPEYLWSLMKTDGESAMDVGRYRAEREEGGFSYTNAVVCIKDSELLGMILAYPQDDPYELGDITQYSNVVRPLVELESLAPGSWYINAIATFEDYRGKGVARRLMENSEIRAHSSGCKEISLIVASKNIPARTLYASLGYQAVDSRPVVPYPGGMHGGDWLLMIKRN